MPIDPTREEVIGPTREIPQNAVQERQSVYSDLKRRFFP